MSAKAIEDSVIVKLPMIAFKDIFDENPDIFIRMMQVIMIRLQRVTFTALHQYLGLSSELVNQVSLVIFGISNRIWLICDKVVLYETY